MVLLVSGVALALAWQLPASGTIALWGVSLLLGFTLYHGAFGFTGAYRRLFTDRDGRGAQAQLLMLAVASVLFSLVFANQQAWGLDLYGAWAPVGVQVAVGAFLFGVGMQLGGGCGSGTLFAVGGGDARLLVTLIFFCIGSFWASLHLGWWQQLPGIDAVVIGNHLGWFAATSLQLLIFALIAVLLRWWSRAPSPFGDVGQPSSLERLWRGPWRLWEAALLLALLNFAVLLMAGHPWTITWAFSLWGAKAAAIMGWDPASSGFWSSPFQQAALAGGLLEDTTSMMDIGIMLGALAAASLAGRFAPDPRIPIKPLAAAVLGGLAMGYGARIAFGCNIGAFFSGVASGSLHGWLWIAAALPGNWVGVKLRPKFSLFD